MRRRHPLLVTSLAACCGLLVLAPAVAGAATPGPDQPTVAVSGTLLQIPAEPDSGRDDTAYALRLAGGAIVPVDPALSGTPVPNARFSGDLVVPGAVQASLAARGTVLEDGDSVSASSTAGRQALALVASASSAGAGPTTVTDVEIGAPTAAAAAATSTHRLRVAVPDNLGTTASSDATILAQMRTVAAYWDDESDGAVDVVAPTSVLHYTSSVSGAAGDCGLGANASSTFPRMAAEAARKFSDYNSATDQVVVLAPENGCSGSGFALGIGVVGNGFSSNGYLIATARSSYTVGTVAHEMGHNYGFLHSNVRCGTSCAKEYDGIFDLMGYGIAGVNQLPALGTAYRVVDNITADGEVDPISVSTGPAATRTVAARQSETGRRSLAVTDPADGTVYYVDFRSGTGQDAGTAYARGMSVDGYAFRSGVVVSSLYRTSGGRAAAGGALVVPNGTRTAARTGETWTSPSGRVQVAVESLASEAATVTVSFPGSTTTAPAPAPATGTTAPTSAGAIPATSAPRASGAVRVGSRVSAVPGRWTEGTTFTYQWRAAGRVVGTSSSWTPTAAYRGRALVLSVTGHHDGYAATTRSSSLGRVGWGVLASTTPRVYGVRAVGRVLRLSRGTWTSGTTLSQVWYVHGRAVSGATAMRLSKAARGKSVVVRVVGRRAGYATVVRSSAAVGPVQRH